MTKTRLDTQTGFLHGTGSAFFRFSCLLILVFLPLFGQQSTSGLSQNVKEVVARIQALAIYPNLEKKRLYGGVEKGRAIRFDLKDITEPAQSLVIGIAGDGTLREFLITVYDGRFTEEDAPVLRREKVTGENQWVFEILYPPQDVVVEIRNVNSSQGLSVVEIVHGYYFGFTGDKTINRPLPSQGNPANNGNRPNNSNSEKLSPNDIQNRVEFFRAPFKE